jgi:hypothetical protein
MEWAELTLGPLHDVVGRDVCSRHRSQGIGLTCPGDQVRGCIARHGMEECTVLRLVFSMPIVRASDLPSISLSLCVISGRGTTNFENATAVRLDGVPARVCPGCARNDDSCADERGCESKGGEDGAPHRCEGVLGGRRGALISSATFPVGFVLPFPWRERSTAQSLIGIEGKHDQVVSADLASRGSSA